MGRVKTLLPDETCPVEDLLRDEPPRPEDDDSPDPRDADRLDARTELEF